MEVGDLEPIGFDLVNDQVVRTIPEVEPEYPANLLEWEKTLFRQDGETDPKYLNAPRNEKLFASAIQQGCPADWLKQTMSIFVDAKDLREKFAYILANMDPEEPIKVDWENVAVMATFGMNFFKDNLPRLTVQEEYLTVFTGFDKFKSHANVQMDPVKPYDDEYAHFLTIQGPIAIPVHDIEKTYAIVCDFFSAIDATSAKHKYVILDKVADPAIFTIVSCLGSNYKFRIGKDKTVNYEKKSQPGKTTTESSAISGTITRELLKYFDKRVCKYRPPGAEFPFEGDLNWIYVHLFQTVPHDILTVLRRNINGRLGRVSAEIDADVAKLGIDIGRDIAKGSELSKLAIKDALIEKAGAMKDAAEVSRYYVDMCTDVNMIHVSDKYWGETSRAAVGDAILQKYQANGYAQLVCLGPSVHNVPEALMDQYEMKGDVPRFVTDDEYPGKLVVGTGVTRRVDLLANREKKFVEFEDKDKKRQRLQLHRHIFVDDLKIFPEVTTDSENDEENKDVRRVIGGMNQWAEFLKFHDGSSLTIKHSICNLTTFYRVANAALAHGFCVDLIRHPRRNTDVMYWIIQKEDSEEKRIASRSRVLSIYNVLLKDVAYCIKLTINNISSGCYVPPKKATLHFKRLPLISVRVLATRLMKKTISKGGMMDIKTRRDLANELKMDISSMITEPTTESREKTTMKRSRITKLKPTVTAPGKEVDDKMEDIRPI